MQNTAGGDNHGLPRACGRVRRGDAAIGRNAQHENAKPIIFGQHGFQGSITPRGECFGIARQDRVRQHIALRALHHAFARCRQEMRAGAIRAGTEREIFQPAITGRDRPITCAGASEMRHDRPNIMPANAPATIHHHLELVHEMEMRMHNGIRFLFHQKGLRWPDFTRRRRDEDLCIHRIGVNGIGGFRRWRRAEIIRPPNTPTTRRIARETCRRRLAQGICVNHPPILPLSANPARPVAEARRIPP